MQVYVGPLDNDGRIVNGLIAAQYALWMMTSSPMQLHKANPGQPPQPRIRLSLVPECAVEFLGIKPYGDLSHIKALRIGIA